LGDNPYIVTDGNVSNVIALATVVGYGVTFDDIEVVLDVLDWRNEPAHSGTNHHHHHSIDFDDLGEHSIQEVAVSFDNFVGELWVFCSDLSYVGVVSHLVAP
jgi:hypothetical protein